MQSVMSTPAAATDPAQHSHDPNNPMIQLASASEQYANSGHNHMHNASSFVDSDAAFAGGSAAYTAPTNTASMHGAPQHNNDTATNMSTSQDQIQSQGQGQGSQGHVIPQNQTHLPPQTQGMTNFGVNNHNVNLNSSPVAPPHTTSVSTSSPGPSNALAQSAIREFVIPYPSPPSENLSNKKKRKVSGGAKAHQLPMFLTKTYHMIEKCDGEVATWSENGDNFVVKNVEKFASSILPQYFKHSNFSSFARQLNFYGFRKLKAEPILTADYDARTASYVRFYHEKFQKDRPELLVHIKRATKSDVHAKDDVESMRAEIQHLNDVIAGMQNEFDRRLADMYMDLSAKYNSLYQSMDGINQQMRLSHGASMAGGQHQGQGQGQVQVQPKAQAQNQPQSLNHSHSQPSQGKNGQTFQASAVPAPAKKGGTDMLHALSEACLTLKSPALPPMHPNNGKEKQGFENFSLK